jgi:hypothetical protein
VYDFKSTTTKLNWQVKWSYFHYIIVWNGLNKIVKIKTINMFWVSYPLCEWKVLIGCDGVNSVVAKWLGFKNPTFTGRCAIRGCVDFKRSHGFAPKFMMFVGKGFQSGFIPCNDQTVFWFFTWTPSGQGQLNCLIINNNAFGACNLLE